MWPLTIMRLILMPRNGSATSSKPDTSPRGTLTSEASLTCGLTTCEATINATSSPALADGRSPSDLPDGPTTDLFGRALVPVSHTRAPRTDGVGGGMTSDGICGLLGGASSLRVIHARYLVNRLPKSDIGLMRSAMTWKIWVTPLGRRFSRLAVSVKTMCDTGFILLATPTSTANQGSPAMRKKHPGCRNISVSPESWRRRMGYPPEWDDCAPTVMPSSRKSRRNSSKRFD